MSDNEQIEILVIGLGAIGTVYGWILSQNANVRVTAIARSTYEHMNEHGIDFDSVKFGHHKGWKPYRIVRDATEANDRRYKFIVMSNKCIPDLLPAAEILAPFLKGEHGQMSASDLSAGPTVVLIQNGIGLEHPIQVAYPKVPIISTVSWIGTNLHPGGKVTHGPLEKLVIGLYQGEGGADDALGDPAGYLSAEGSQRLKEGQRRTELFAHLLQSGGGTVELADDIQPKRYRKSLWNASFGLVCALSRSTVSAVVSPDSLPFTIPVVRRLMLEVTYVARAWGYGEDVLPLSAADETIKMTLKNWQIREPGKPLGTPSTPMVEDEETENPLEKDAAKSRFKPSILLDLEAGRPMELETILGALLDRARAKGVETPRLDQAYGVLKVNQDFALAQLDKSDSYQNHVRQWEGKKPLEVNVSHAEKAQNAARILLTRRESATVEMARGKSKLNGKPIPLVGEESEPPSDAN